MRSWALEAAPTVAGERAAMRLGGRLFRRLDLVGLALLAAAVGWTYASAGASDGDPGPVAGLFLACAAAAIMGRLVGAVSRAAGAALLVAAALVPALGSLGGIIDSPRTDPFGYSNATGAFFVQATCGALVMATAARHGFARVAGIFLAIGFAALTVRTRSAAGVILLALPVAALAIRSREAVQRAAVGAAGLIVAALVAAILIAALQPSLEGSSPVSRAVDATLSQRRPALWRDAIRIMAEHPLTGVGPGQFDAERRVAASDQDLRWAHNGFLQQGAEQGVPGLALLLLAFIWGAARLRAAAVGGLAAALGAASLAALAVHANVDYVLHVPAVPIAAAALFGVATAVPSRRPGGDRTGWDWQG